MAVKISVVVPVYNPGEHIEPLIDSLLRQTMPPSEFEAIFVDDGSTDETPERLDSLAATHPHMRVIHIPNSGWPGKPRNVGIDASAGEYVQFVDNDDVLGVEALERLYAFATQHNSDVVVGKEIRHPRGWVLWGLFDVNRPHAQLGRDSLLAPLTPHKMFRKELLDKHQIRFPEGPRRLEDHPFVVRSYFAADVISVLSDYPVYEWVQRGDNAGSRPSDWAAWYGHMNDVLDVVVEHTEPGQFRDRLLSFWYQGKTLGYGGKAVGNLPEDEARDLFEVIRAFTEQRFPPPVDAYLPPARKIRSALVRSGDFERMRGLVRSEAGFEIEQQLTKFEGVDGVLRVHGRFTLRFGDAGPVTFRKREGRLIWLPPVDLGDSVPDELLDFTESVKATQTKLVLRNRRTFDVFSVTGQNRLVSFDSGDQALSLDTTFTVDPESVATGHPLTADVHDVWIVLNSSGWGTRAPLESGTGSTDRKPLHPPLQSRPVVQPFNTVTGRVALDVGHRVFPPKLELGPPDVASCRLVSTEDSLDLHLPLATSSGVDQPLRGKLRLVEMSGPRLVRFPLRVRPQGQGRSARLVARLPRHRLDAMRGHEIRRFRLEAGVRGQHVPLSLVLEVRPRAGVTVRDEDGAVLGQEIAARGPARAVIRLARHLRSAVGRGRRRIARVRRG